MQIHLLMMGGENLNAVLVTSFGSLDVWSDIQQRGYRGLTLPC